MSTASVRLSPAVLTAGSVGGSRRRESSTGVRFITGLNAYDGLKAQNRVTSVGLPVSAEQCFTKIVSSMNSQGRGRGRGGGVLSSKCSAIAEIVTIAATMNGLVLVGVAVGFVLLRIEASLEEAAE